MKTFIKSIKIKEDLFCVFEDDGETGYLYSYSPNSNKIYLDLIIYQIEPKVLEPKEKDVKLVYDEQSNQCGVYVWGKLRGYMELPDIKRERLKFSSPDDIGVSNNELPEAYLENNGSQDRLDSINEGQFINDRQSYWKNVATNLEKNN